MVGVHVRDIRHRVASLVLKRTHIYNVLFEQTSRTLLIKIVRGSFKYERAFKETRIFKGV